MGLFTWLSRKLGFQPDGSVLVRNTPEGKLWAKIADGTCPDCGSRTGFFEGPSGGMSTNIQCADCGHWFNVTPVIGRAERIGK